MTRFISEGAQFLKTSSENPPLIIPGVAKRTQGPGAFIMERSKFFTATSKQRQMNGAQVGHKIGHETEILRWTNFGTSRETFFWFLP